MMRQHGRRRHRDSPRVPRETRTHHRECFLGHGRVVRFIRLGRVCCVEAPLLRRPAQVLSAASGGAECAHRRNQWGHPPPVHTRGRLETCALQRSLPMREFAERARPTVALSPHMAVSKYARASGPTPSHPVSRLPARLIHTFIYR